MIKRREMLGVIGTLGSRMAGLGAIGPSLSGCRVDECTYDWELRGLGLDSVEMVDRPLFGVYGDNESGSALIVGSAGTVLAEGQSINVGTSEDLFGVHMNLICGASGTLLFREGTQWSPRDVGTTRDLRTVVQDDAGDAVAGDGGAWFRPLGSGDWERVEGADDWPWTTASRADYESDGAILFGGGEGRIIRLDLSTGTTSEFLSPTSNDIVRIERAFDSIQIVTANGDLFVSLDRGVSWKSLHSGIPASAGGRFWVLGGDGVAAHDDTNWVRAAVGDESVELLAGWDYSRMDNSVDSTQYFGCVGRRGSGGVIAHFSAASGDHYTGPPWGARECALYGRPLMIGHQPRLAPVRSGSAWLSARYPQVSQVRLSREETQTIGAHYLNAARNEHASAAAFARFGLELLALGAPSSLVRASFEALGDELRHARVMFELAARFGGDAWEPGPFPEASPPIDIDPTSVAVAVARDGCINETASAAVMAVALHRTRDPVIRAALGEILQDEEKHAALAFRALAWLCERFPEVRGPVAQVFHRAQFTFARTPARERCEQGTLSKFGVLLGSTQHEVMRTALEHLVLPAVGIRPLPPSGSVGVC